PSKKSNTPSCGNTKTPLTVYLQLKDTGSYRISCSSCANNSMNIPGWSNLLLSLIKIAVNNLRNHFSRTGPGYVENLHPLRAELFSVDQMEVFGKILAAEHSVSDRRGDDY